jgi:hypothetical protein
MQAFAFSTAASRATAPATAAASARAGVRAVGRVLARGGVPGDGDGLLAAAEHVGAEVLDRLERADRAAELLADRRVGGARSRHQAATPAASAAASVAARSRTSSVVAVSERAGRARGRPSQRDVRDVAGEVERAAGGVDA